MEARNEIHHHAAGNLAVSKLVVVGRYLDLVERGELNLCAERYQGCAAGAQDILRQYRTNLLVRAACADIPALRELLENVDYAEGAGPLARVSAAESQLTRG